MTDKDKKVKHSTQEQISKAMMQIHEESIEQAKLQKMEILVNLILNDDSVREETKEKARSLYSEYMFYHSLSSEE